LLQIFLILYNHCWVFLSKNSGQKR
jgi:hypothetical protein